MSDFFMPERSNSFSVTSTGPVSIIAGSEPILAKARILARGVSIDVVARKSVFGRDQIGRDTLRHEIGRHCDRGIHRPGAAGGADPDAAHRFGATADREFMLAAHDLRGGEIHGVQPRGTEPA